MKWLNKGCFFLFQGDGVMAWHGKIRPGLLLLLFSFVVISEATAKAAGELYMLFYYIMAEQKLELTDERLISG